MNTKLTIKYLAVAAFAAAAGFYASWKIHTPLYQAHKQRTQHASLAVNAETLSRFLDNQSRSRFDLNKGQLTWLMLNQWHAMLRTLESRQNLTFPNTVLNSIPGSLRQRQQNLARRTLALWRAGAFEITNQPAPGWSKLDDIKLAAIKTGLFEIAATEDHP